MESRCAGGAAGRVHRRHHYLTHPAGVPVWVVEFADLPTIKGKRELDRIIPARLARQKHYRLTKTLRFVSGNTIVGSWVADWTDGITGRPMNGKGIEFIEMRDGKCARWEATFNAWDAQARKFT